MTQLRMANVRSDRRFHSLFDPSGTTGGLDFDDAILGTGRLVTRFLRAEPGTPAEGLTVFEYFIDLSEVDGDGRSVTAFSLGFDPLVDYLDYNADGTPDHVFVITELSSGSVAPRSADRIGRRITFTFDPPIRPGRPYYDGGMSYPFRMASQYYDYGPWSASVTFDDGSGANVQAWVPRPTPPRRIDEEIWQAWGTIIGSECVLSVAKHLMIVTFPEPNALQQRLHFLLDGGFISDLRLVESRRK